MVAMTLQDGRQLVLNCDFSQPFGEMNLFFTQWFVSKNVIDWTSLRKKTIHKKNEVKKYGFTQLKKKY